MGIRGKGIKVIAFYLPQFHPIAENDEWWGKGFTEWTNVGKTKPLFKGHYQPRVPADLGYYDLRMPETREAQAELARYCGIEGFAYWHYWFGGKRLLERPFNEVLASGSPTLPFCLAWANESWSGIWNNQPGRILIEQVYPGLDDNIAHFFENLAAFSDKRYIRIDGRPVFFIYRPFGLTNPHEFMECWNTLAVKNNLDEFYFIGFTRKKSEIGKILELGFDAVNIVGITDAKKKISLIKNTIVSGLGKYFGGYGALSIWEYEDIIANWVTEDYYREEIIPSLYPNWDNSPRSGRRGFIVNNSNPILFEKHIRELIKTVENKKNKILFLKSWNEWAEGNYVEPDLAFGLGYIEALRKNLIK
jgi:hypothetical protein